MTTLSEERPRSPQQDPVEASPPITTSKDMPPQSPPLPHHPSCSCGQCIMDLLGHLSKSSGAEEESKPLNQSVPPQKGLGDFSRVSTVLGDEVDGETPAELLLTLTMVVMLGLVAVYGIMST